MTDEEKERCIELQSKFNALKNGYEALLEADSELQSKHERLVAAARDVAAKLPDERQREAANKHIDAALAGNVGSKQGKQTDG